MSGVQGSPRASMLLNQLARGELNSSLSTIGEHSVAGATSMSQAGGSAAGSVSGEGSPSVDILGLHGGLAERAACTAVSCHQGRADRLKTSLLTECSAHQERCSLVDLICRVLAGCVERGACQARALSSVQASAFCQNGSPFRTALDSGPANLLSLCAGPADAQAGPRIFVGKLNKDTTEADVRDHFTRFG